MVTTNQTLANRATFRQNIWAFPMIECYRLLFVFLVFRVSCLFFYE
uniref:Uncharacterized protein n=1 Tax=Anguilla anguilla TaxID=7936 RepID=A0A0E9SVM2_ANGAN